MAETEVVHSRIGASSMYRWSECPGSVRLCAKVPRQPSSPYAEEGTRAHTLASDILEGKSTAKADSEEMLEAVMIYVELVREEAKGADLVLTEHGFHLATLHPELFGTADRMHYHRTKRLLQVYDYKHGAGISVDVENNLQLQYYALGALMSIDGPVDAVEVTVVQPRCPHPSGIVRRWTFEAFTILDFAADLVKFAEETEKPDAKLFAGDHCRFCNASGICPEIKNKAQNIAKMDFDAIPEDFEASKTPMALELVPGNSVEMETYDPSKLSKTLKWLPAVEAWCESVRKFAYSEAMAGRTPPGWKLVEKRAHRKWKSDYDTTQSEIYKKFKIFEEDIVGEKKLKSPAQVEKLIAPELKSELKDLVVQESSGATLVPETDPRPAVVIETAKDCFEAVDTLLSRAIEEGDIDTIDSLL